MLVYENFIVVIFVDSYGITSLVDGYNIILYYFVRRMVIKKPFI